MSSKLKEFYAGNNRPIGMNSALKERIEITKTETEQLTKMQKIADKTEQVVLSARTPEEQAVARTYKALAEAAMSRLAKNN